MTRHLRVISTINSEGTIIREFARKSHALDYTIVPDIETLQRSDSVGNVEYTIFSQLSLANDTALQRDNSPVCSESPYGQPRTFVARVKIPD